MLAKYEGDDEYCSARPRSTTSNPGEGQTALFAFVVPILDIPINIPVAVRTGGDYGLRFTVQDITQVDAARGRRNHLLGLPRRLPATTVSASPKARRATRRAAQLGDPTPRAVRPTESSIPVRPLTDNPTTLHRPAAADTA